MILNLKFHNPIKNEDDVLKIYSRDITPFIFKRIKDVKSDDDIIYILNDLLYTDLNVAKEKTAYNTQSFTYDNKLSIYYFYLIKLNNQITYNNYIDKLIKIHCNNLEFEANNIHTEQNIIIKHKRNKTVKNKYIKHTTKDLITGQTMYHYGNERLGKEIISSNPNLSDTLNNKTHRRAGVPMSAMTFSFKRKDK